MGEHIKRLQEIELERRDYIKMFVNDPEPYGSTEKIFQNVIINVLDKDVLMEKKVIKNLGRIGIVETKNSTNDINLDAVKKIEIEKIMEEQPTMSSSARLTYRSPFREEKVGSLVVYKDTNTWYDFGEGVGGDNIALVMKMHGYNFIEACNYIKNL